MDFEDDYGDDSGNEGVDNGELSLPKCKQCMCQCSIDVWMDSYHDENGTRFSQVFAQLGIRDLRGDGCGPEIRKRGRQCGPSISGIFRLLVGQSLQIGVLEFLAQTVLVRRWMVLFFLHPGQ